MFRCPFRPQGHCTSTVAAVPLVRRHLPRRPVLKPRGPPLEMMSQDKVERKQLLGWKNGGESQRRAGVQFFPSGRGQALRGARRRWAGPLGSASRPGFVFRLNARGYGESRSSATGKSSPGAIAEDTLRSSALWWTPGRADLCLRAYTPLAPWRAVSVLPEAGALQVPGGKRDWHACSHRPRVQSGIWAEHQEPRTARGSALAAAQQGPHGAGRPARLRAACEGRAELCAQGGTPSWLTGSSSHASNAYGGRMRTSQSDRWRDFHGTLTEKTTFFLSSPSEASSRKPSGESSCAPFHTARDHRTWRAPRSSGPGAPAPLFPSKCLMVTDG